MYVKMSGIIFLDIIFNNYALNIAVWFILFYLSLQMKKKIKRSNRIIIYFVCPSVPVRMNVRVGVSFCIPTIEKDRDSNI